MATSLEDELDKSEEDSRLQSGDEGKKMSFVLDSQYIGESRLGEPHMAKLLVSSNVNNKSQHLFRWKYVSVPAISMLSVN